MTEVTGHVIDPDGEARRALLEAVAEHGPGALSDATFMDNLCRNRLAALPGESILIVSAARADVPALLRNEIPALGNYGAIQSVAATLARASDLDNAASLWVVREFARTLGMIAPGGTQPTPRIVPGGPAAEASAVGAGAAGAGAGAAAAGAAAAGAGVPPPGTSGAGAPPPGMAGGTGGPPTGKPRRSRGLTRNTIGVAAAIALVAGYLGVAAAAHLSPFPAETVAASSSQSPGTGSSTSPGTSPSTTPSTSPSGSPDASPTSDFDVLLSKIPASVQGHNNCQLAGSQYGASAVIQCSRLNNLAAGTIIYYSYPSQAKLSGGISAFLSKVGFSKQRECTTGSEFTDFLVECQSNFHNPSPSITGSIAEYSSTSHDPIIVTSDNEQKVMVVMVGTNPGDLLTYWKQLNWIVR